MSFTTEVAEELLSLPVGKTCCRKALLYGLFFGGRSRSEGNMVSAVFRHKKVAELACELLSRQFSALADLEELTVAGRQVFKLCVKSKALALFVSEIIGDSERELREIAGFRCGNCAHDFLRGVFLSAATINDPRRGYHLEFSFDDERVADRLFLFLTKESAAPKKILRNKKVGVYYKSNGAIGDIIYYVGASKASFDFANVCIEKDIRNIENRATNCVARNISRSVGASQKHISAIEYIQACHKLETLSEELRYTAELRCEYDSASLAELAMLHNPPITKSGLNQRLIKILSIAEDLIRIFHRRY